MRAKGGVLKLLRLNEPRAHAATMAAVFTAIGLALLFQPGRFANTPSYANLLELLPQWGWAVIYLAVAALKVSAIWRYSIRSLVVAAHMGAIALEGVWWIAFVIRYLTDNGTTVVNVVSWSVFLYLSVRSALMLDQHTGGNG